MNIYSDKQFYEADKVTTEKQGITSSDLIERAAGQIFKWLHQRMQGAQVPIHIFCGIGNNGGDGLALGRILIEQGYNVNVFIANFTDKRSKCFLINYGRIKDVTKKWPVLMTSEKDFPEIHPDDIIIDALFGIGLNRPIEGWVKNLIIYLNQEKAFKLAIDIPSGLTANAAVMDPEAVLKANHTLTFQAPKLAFFLPESGKFVPYFEVLDIGLDPEFLFSIPPLAQLMGKAQVQPIYRQREKYSHKGDYGHALIVAGSKGKMGAARMASEAVLRIGAGMVTTFVPSSGNDILQTSLPEAMTISDTHPDVITSVAFDFEPTAIGVGMGIGTSETTQKALVELFKANKETPFLIDADAINCIAANRTLLKAVPKHSILTPHLGELERLIGKWTDDHDRLAKVKAFSTKHEVIVVMKGAHSIVVAGENLFINSTGNPGMATAGSGDVLAGMITGLLAQGYDPTAAATFGVYLHGSAGNLVTQEKGFEALIASDITNTVGRAFMALFEPDQPVQPEEQQE